MTEERQLGQAGHMVHKELEELDREHNTHRNRKLEYKPKAKSNNRDILVCVRVCVIILTESLSLKLCTWQITAHH